MYVRPRPRRRGLTFFSLRDCARFRQKSHALDPRSTADARAFHHLPAKGILAGDGGDREKGKKLAPLHRGQAKPDDLILSG